MLLYKDLQFYALSNACLSLALKRCDQETSRGTSGKGPEAWLGVLTFLFYSSPWVLHRSLSQGDLGFSAPNIVYLVKGEKEAELVWDYFVTYVISGL